MSVWKLTPIKTDDARWANRRPAPVIIRAANVEVARDIASRKFDDMREGDNWQDSPDTFLWLRDEFVRAEKVENERWPNEGPEEVLWPTGYK